MAVQNGCEPDKAYLYRCGKKQEESYAPEILEILADSTLPDESADESIIEQHYDEIINSLNEEDKNILLDICENKMKLKEIAVKYNLSLSAAKQRSVRLKARVRACIKKLISENDG